MAIQTKGFCKYCGKECTKSGMLRHFSACKERKARLEEKSKTGKKQQGYFQLLISGKYRKEYWLIIEANENVTLKELDNFIRKIWVECCEHLSAFEINGVQYESYPNPDRFWGPPVKNMNYRLRDVVRTGDIINYEYDFGSTTELELKVHDYRIGRDTKDQITILSRNNPIRFVCDQCGKNEAKWVDPDGFYDGMPFWCDECWDEERMDDDYCLLISNSPRMGVCGYEGSTAYPEQFEPDKK